jgi:hypothetical protein
VVRRRAAGKYGAGYRTKGGKQHNGYKCLFHGIAVFKVYKYLFMRYCFGFVTFG